MKLLKSLTITVALLAAFAFSGPVSHFGMLKACKISNKGQICGEKTGQSTAIQVKGPSLFWSSGVGASFYQQATVDWFVDNMEIGIIRAAMAIKYNGNNTGIIAGSGASPEGYDTQPAVQKGMVEAVIDAAILNDIYVIVDWHSHNAEDEQTKAVAFFGDMAKKYKDVPNIIWEVYNEPVNTDASRIDTYAKAVHKAIRDAGSKNLVIIGSRQWSQNPSSQATQYGNSDKAVTDNVAFVFHFYSETHQQSGSIGSSATSAMNSGYAVFASEWGFTNADGDGNVGQASDWKTYMDNNKISNCNWSVSAINEASAMFTSGTTVANLATSRLTTSGKNFQSYMGTNKWTAQIPSTHPKGNDVSVTVKDGNSINLTTQLGLDGNVTAVSQPEAGTASFTSTSVTYTTSQSGSASEKVNFTYKITKNNVTVQRRVTVEITDRRPILPQKNPIAVSRKAPTNLDLTQNFSATDPSKLTLSFKEVSLDPSNRGTIEIKGQNRDSLLFTPNASLSNTDLTEVTLNYTIQNTAGTFSSASAILQIQNLKPVINKVITYNCCLYSQPNTGAIGIGIAQVAGRDQDGDSLWFEELYLSNQYPGRLENVKADSFVYYPDNNKTGKVVFLAVITDGSLHSDIGRSAVVLTGNGQDIGNITVPTEIPGYNAPVTPIALSMGNAGNFGMTMLGSGRVAINFAQNGSAKLDVYSLSGKNMGTLLNGHQNAGSAEVSLAALNLQKGVYILRLRQGAQVKTLRVVN